MNFQYYLPECCSVGFLSGFNYDDHNFRYQDNRLPAISSTSGTFVAIFHRQQKHAFLQVCRRHRLLSVATSPGDLGPRRSHKLAICVFQRGKGNE